MRCWQRAPTPAARHRSFGDLWRKALRASDVWRADIASHSISIGAIGSRAIVSAGVTLHSGRRLAPQARTPIRFEKLAKAVPLFARGDTWVETARVPRGSDCSAIIGVVQSDSKEGIELGTHDAAASGPSVVADVHYHVDQRLLLLGEANFTFASALGKRLGDCSSITATCLESRAELLSRFGHSIAARIASLEDSLCGIHYSVSASELPARFREGSFDCVAFNFPLAEPGPSESSSLAHPAEEGDSEDIASQRLRSKHGTRARAAYESLSMLLDDFFRGAAHVLRPGGECHLRLTDQYATARGLRAAHGHGLHFVSRIDFGIAFERVFKPLGYRPTALPPSSVGKRRRTKNFKAGFDVEHSSTFVFQRGP